MISSANLPRPGLSLSLIFVGLVSWYASGINSSKSTSTQSQQPHVASYFVRNLSMTSMGSNGLPENHVETIKMVQFLDDLTTEMTHPKYHFYRTDQPTWNITSNQGWLSADGELALLSGRVTIIRPANGKTASFKLVTSDLRLQPKNNYIETDNAVTAKSGHDQIKAIGMQAWMGTPSRIKFLAKVRANYDPR